MAFVELSLIFCIYNRRVGVSFVVRVGFYLYRNYTPVLGPQIEFCAMAGFPVCGEVDTLMEFLGRVI